MVGFTGVVNPKCACFVIGLPNDITCWHFPKGRIKPEEALHLIIVTARARDAEAYPNAEMEKGHLNLLEHAKRRYAGKKAAITRQLREEGFI